MSTFRKRFVTKRNASCFKILALVIASKALVLLHLSLLSSVAYFGLPPQGYVFDHVNQTLPDSCYLEMFPNEPTIRQEVYEQLGPSVNTLYLAGYTALYYQDLWPRLNPYFTILPGHLQPSPLPFGPILLLAHGYLQIRLLCSLLLWLLSPTKLIPLINRNMRIRFMTLTLFTVGYLLSGTNSELPFVAHATSLAQFALVA